MTIFILGDSHTIFFHCSYEVDENKKANPDSLIKIAWYASSEAWPVTMYTFNTTTLDLYNIATPYYNKSARKNIVSGDTVVFTYGWNDIAKNISKYNKNNYEEFIQNMVLKYIEKCIMYKNIFNIIPVIQCVYPNPLVLKPSMTGTNVERNIYVKFMNKCIQQECNKFKIPFFDIFDILIDTNTCIKLEYLSEDKLHLDHKNKYLNKIIYEELMKVTT